MTEPKAPDTPIENFNDPSQDNPQSSNGAAAVDARTLHEIRRNTVSAVEAMRGFTSGPNAQVLKDLNNNLSGASVSDLIRKHSFFIDPQRTGISDLAREIQTVQLVLPTVGQQIADFLNQLDTDKIALDFKRFVDQIAVVSNALNDAFQPTIQNIAAISAQLAKAVEPHHLTMTSKSAWEASLAARMALLKTTWASETNFEVSIRGFAQLARLSDVVHAGHPFSEPIGEFLNEELGHTPDEITDDEPAKRDERAVESGLNPALIAFPSDAYGDVLTAVGFQFQFRFQGPPVPQAIEFVDTDVSFNPFHNSVITEIEQRLRQLIETHLRALSPKWLKQRVPEAVRKRWLERQAEDRDLGRPVYSPIQYADFMDMADIIVQGKNWPDVFQSIFLNQEDFVVSLRRLHPVRKAIAHGRPLSKFDGLTLASEATRLFRALGVRIDL